MDFDKKEFSTYLDGVPFSVGQKFCPPRAVHVPDEVLCYEPPSELLSEDFHYDFLVESKVLANIEAEKKKKQEKLERQSTKAKPPEPSPLSNGTAASMKPVSASIPLWPAVPILQPKSKSLINSVPAVRSENIRKINLSDFENDTPSPFDYMELQTINDMEELSTVFQGLCKTQKEPASEKLPADNKSEIASTSDTSQNVGNVSKSMSFPLPESFDLSKPAVSSEPQSSAAALSSSSSSISKSFVKNSENYLSYSYPNMPDAFSGRSDASWACERVKRNSFNSDSTVPNNSLALSQVPSVSSDPGQGRYAGGHPRVSGHPALPLRSSKSIPDLTNLLPNDEAVPQLERSHTPPANRRVSCSSQDEQTLVKAPYVEYSSPKRSVWSSNGLLTCNTVQPDKTMAEEKQHPQPPDPYYELTNTEKRIVDFITDMGFLRGQVSRTVKHLGTDEKKVVEHLCQIQALEESGYDKLEAENALHLHDYDKDEAIRYLDLLNQFQDLGFEKDAIRKALVQNKNDRDKVIDALLS